MRKSPTITAALIASLLTMTAVAAPADAAVIGVVAPKSGNYALLGSQIFQGARAAATANGDSVVEIDESCDEAGGTAAAKSLVDAKATIAIGFLCVETLTTALPQLKSAGIPAVSISVRSKILMEDALRNAWPFFRMAPVEGNEADVAATTILRLWKAEPIGFVDDGTIYGRELVSAIRQKLEPSGITPVFTDTYRPGQEQQVALVRRLAKAGATHVFAGGDRNDLATIARDAASENIPLTLMGGDAMRAPDKPIALRDGVLAIALPDYASLPSATAASLQLRKADVEPDGYTLPAYAAAEVAHQAMLAASTMNGSVLDTLAHGRFLTAIGPIAFDAGHELKDTPYRLQEWRDAGFVATGPAPQ